MRNLHTRMTQMLAIQDILGEDGCTQLVLAIQADQELEQAMAEALMELCTDDRPVPVFHPSRVAKKRVKPNPIVSPVKPPVAPTAPSPLTAAIDNFVMLTNVDTFDARLADMGNTYGFKEVIEFVANERKHHAYLEAIPHVALVDAFGATGAVKMRSRLELLMEADLLIGAHNFPTTDVTVRNDVTERAWKLLVTYLLTWCGVTAGKAI